MNRRNFLTAALPAVMGTVALGARASTTGATAPPRRIKIEVSHLKPSQGFGDLATNTVVVVAVEGVETYAAFTRFNNLAGYDSKTNRAIPVAQPIGPSYLRVTPRVEPDGKITVVANVQFEEPAISSAPSSDAAVSIAVMKLDGCKHTLESGQSVMLDSLPGVKPQIQLTATLLGPHQDA